MPVIHRDAEPLLAELARSYPIVTITGPRQSGKSTLARQQFATKPYISLEELDQREFAETDPRGFLAQFPDGAVIDEAQRCPALFTYLQGIVDQAKRPGMFVLTGSQQFGLLSGITQSLAGRAGLLELLPFSLSELTPWVESLDKLLLAGLYPPIHDRGLRPELWLEDYTRTYIERDVRMLVAVKDLSAFQTFLRLCAARNGQLINYSELANAADLDMRTVKNWISVLEASYIVFRLHPYHRNFSKKLVKSSKLYFYDCGLLAHLLRITDKDIAVTPYRGSLFETLLISEFVKFKCNRRTVMDFFFWRDNKGVEIDLLVESGSVVYPIEFKSGQTVHDRFFANLNRFVGYAGEATAKPIVVYAGDHPQPRRNAEVIPWHHLLPALQRFV